MLVGAQVDFTPNHRLSTNSSGGSSSLGNADEPCIDVGAHDVVVEHRDVEARHVDHQQEEHAQQGDGRV